MVFARSARWQRWARFGKSQGTIMDSLLDVLSHTADGVFAVDAQQRIVFWNAAAEGILGYGAAEVIGRSCHEVMHGEPRPGCLACAPNCPVQFAAGRGETVPAYNLLSRTKNGETILLNVSVIVPATDESQVATIHLFRDATHQLRYETYVEQLLCAAARLPQPQTLRHHDLLHDSPALAPLSAREKAVLSLLVQGQAARDIAKTLCISYATVRNHLSAILRKLGVHSQREAVKLAVEHRLI
jgi:PAS domain S-box-containing protein